MKSTPRKQSTVGLAQEEIGELMRQLIAEIDEFRGDKPVLDDMTCLILNWRGSGTDDQI